MRFHGLLGTIIVCICTLVLTSCANNRNIFNSQVRPDLTRESWMRQMNVSTSHWLNHVDGWFYNGSPDLAERYDNRASYDQAITSSEIRVPNFTNIQVDGPYNVQMVGGLSHNRVYLYGPSLVVRQTVVEIRGNSIFIHPTKDANVPMLSKLVIRIAVGNLQNLYFNGGGNIEGKNIMSNSLNIYNNNCGHLTLAGNMNVRYIKQGGPGSTTIIGAYTPSLSIKAYQGIINLTGRVGVRSIDNQNGLVNIVGADTDNLTILACNGSKTSISGYANLKNLTAMGKSQVYLYWVNSNGAYINVYDWAHVGLAGCATNLNIQVSNKARFDGQYLHGDTVYVSTRGWSHANVFATQKLFASALEDSSIYFFGSPNVVYRYSTKNGVVLPVWGEACPVMALPPPVHATWKDSRASYKDDMSYSTSGKF